MRGRVHLVGHSHIPEFFFFFNLDDYLRNEEDTPQSGTEKEII